LQARLAGGGGDRLKPAACRGTRARSSEPGFIGAVCGAGAHLLVEADAVTLASCFATAARM
jgi:hypothetical protein